MAEGLLAELRGYTENPPPDLGYRLRILLPTLIAVVEALEPALLQLGRHDHWDRTGGHGTGCETCIDQWAVARQIQAALARPEVPCAMSAMEEEKGGQG